MSKLDGFLILENSFISTPKVMQDNANGTVIEVILQQAEIPNRNGRIYGRDALKEAIYSPVVQEKIKNKAFVGEAGRVAIYNSDIVSKLS